MKRALVFSLAILLWFPASTSFAQVLSTQLRAGEHPDFTRIVFELPEDLAWNLDEGPGYLDLIVTDRTVLFDLSQVFTRIPRSRLLDVQQAEYGLRFQLGCACQIRSVESIPGQIVLDIVSPAVLPTKPEALPKTRPQARPQLGNSDLLAKSAGEAVARALRSGSTIEAASAWSSLERRLAERFPPPETVQAASDRSPQSTSITAISDDLSKAIATGVARNLLRPDTGFETSATSLPFAGLQDAEQHLVSDRAGRPEGQGRSPEQCAAAVSTYIPEWSTPVVPSTTSTDWARLYDPLDNLNTQAAGDLAIDYLRQGFGAEARLVLSLSQQPDEFGALKELSYLLDLAPPPHRNSLLSNAECSDMDALWAFLAAPEERLQAAGITDKLVRALHELPKHLRLHIGPSVLNSLVKMNATEAAKLVQVALDRVMLGTTPAQKSSRQMQIIEALDATMLPNPAEIMGLSNSQLLLFLENAEARDIPLLAGSLEILVTRQFENRRTDFGRNLAMATARALALAQDYTAAFELANSSEADLPPQQRAALSEEIFTRLVHHANDTDFVTSTFLQTPWENEGLSPALLQSLARRLEKLDFPEAAAWLKGRASTVKSTASQDAEASAAPQKQLPASAILTQSRDASSVPDSVAEAGRDLSDEIESAIPQIATPANAEREQTEQPDLAATQPKENQAARLGPLADPGEPVAPQNPSPSDTSTGLLTQGRAVLQSAAALREDLENLIQSSP